ncbi:hypothetical protein C0966_17450 (plasmid) [Bacillus methanolicus]|nr:hypothetical protein [Bacillus methanolicus]
MVAPQRVIRFLLGVPSTFKVIGFLVGIPQVNILTGEQSLSLSCRIGNKDKPVDISPFLEHVKVVH